mmetsp:Transcript_68923/g.111065  ORF Transcript_68923/g.111065 Transcript_68923/m.111065 type:complete len:262 (-) Transcript_68923:42-827(-)
MAASCRHLLLPQALSRVPAARRHFQASATSAIARFHRLSALSVSGGATSSWFGISRPFLASCAQPLGLQTRQFAEAAAAPKLSQDAAKALGSIKEGMKNKQAAQVQLSKAAKRTFPGNIRRYKLMGGRPEFHNVERNRNGRIFEPWHTFEIVISSSKNNCWITVKNKGWKYRTVIASHAGNVGFRAATKKSEAATYAIALNIGRKLKRLGISCAEVTFRKIMKVEVCLQAFQSVGLQVTRLTHQPRLPHGDPTKPRKQRRV